MRIYTINDPEFQNYGQIVDSIDTESLLAEMKKINNPKHGFDYVTSITASEKSKAYDDLLGGPYGYMPIQIGLCYGKNLMLNGLEYHHCSEMQIGESDFFIMTAKREEIVDGKIDSSKVKIFRIPAGIWIELYATTLQYAPCYVDEEKGFKVAIVLLKGTNEPINEDSLAPRTHPQLSAINKWVLAHPDSKEAKNGSYIGIQGVNLVMPKYI